MNFCVTGCRTAYGRVNGSDSPSFALFTPLTQRICIKQALGLLAQASVCIGHMTGHHNIPLSEPDSVV